MEGQAAAPAWRSRLAERAPDVVAVWEALRPSERGVLAARRELRRRATTGTAPRLLREQEAVADELERALRGLPADLLSLPGGEADWNVAQAFAHTTAARRFLVAWAAMAARGAWPADSPPHATPGIPGPPDASRDALLLLLEKSRRSMARSAEDISGHETDRCPLEGTPLGRLRCGEWLLWAGVHDLLHLEQLEAIARRVEPGTNPR